MGDRHPQGGAPGPTTSQMGNETRIEISPGRRERDGMRRIPAAGFAWARRTSTPRNGPSMKYTVDGFWMDEHPVTNAEFRKFVKETGYVTVAERPLDPEQYPDADPELFVPGSLVFRQTTGPVDLNDYRNWWEYVPSAHWRRPGGPGTTFTVEGQPSRGPHRLGGCRGICRLGGQGAALPRRSGSSPAGEGSMGATFAWGDEHFPEGKRWPTAGRASFPGRTSRSTGSLGPRPWAASPPTGTGSTT